MKYMSKNPHYEISIEEHSNIQINDYDWIETPHVQMSLKEASVWLLVSTMFSSSMLVINFAKPLLSPWHPHNCLCSSMLPSYGFHLCSQAAPSVSCRFHHFPAKASAIAFLLLLPLVSCCLWHRCSSCYPHDLWPRQELKKVKWVILNWKHRSNLQWHEVYPTFSLFSSE